MSKTRSNQVISHMNQEERRHWASWIGMIAEGVAGVMAVDGGIPASRDVPDPGPARTRRPLTETASRVHSSETEDTPAFVTLARGTAYWKIRSACSSGRYFACCSARPLHQPGPLWAEPFRVLIPVIAFHKG